MLRRCCSAWARRSTNASSCSANSARSTPTEVPLNFLNPLPGTPSLIRLRVEPLEALRWIALFRIGLPTVILRYAGGREITLRELQVMGMTSGINALIVGNYLTTLGRSPEEDLQMLEDLQMPIGAAPHRRARTTGPVSEPYCPGCGEPIQAHARPTDAVPTRGCLPELDPPRYCGECGGWLAVRVSTGGWAARCRRCGSVTRTGDRGPPRGGPGFTVRR